MNTIVNGAIAATRVVLISALVQFEPSGFGEACAQDKSAGFPPRLDETGSKVVSLVEQLCKVDDVNQSIEQNNGRVVVRTKTIDGVVKKGVDVIPYLVAAMRVEELDFDTFVRCYSACDQIIRTKRPDLHTYWDGGCTLVDTPAEIRRVRPGKQRDDGLYRAKVIDSIVKNYQSIKN